MEGMLYMYLDGPRIGALRRRFPVGQESVLRREQREKQRTERAMYFLFGFHMRVYTDCTMEYGRALHVIIYGDGGRVLAHRHCKLCT